MKVIIPYIPRHKQGFIHQQLELNRWGVLVIHRRYGKTVMLVNHVIKMAMKNKRKSPAPRYMYMAPYAKQAKKLAWDYFKFYCSVIPGVNFNESELRVDLPNGARIYLCGADNANAHRGLYLDGAVLDECGDIDPGVFTSIIRPALSDYGGWCVFSGTPMGKNHFYEFLVHAEANADKGWFSIILKASETKVIPYPELEDAKRIMTPEEYDREYECSFEVWAGKKIYPEFNRNIHVARQSLLPEYPVTVYRGWDNTGLSPAICLSYISDTGQYRVFKEFCFSDTGITEATENLILWCNQMLPYGCKFVDYADPAGKNRDSTKMSPKDYIQRTAMEMGSEIFLKDGIQTWAVRRESVAGRLTKIINGEPAVLFDPSCKTLISGFEGAYAYQEIVSLPGFYKKEAIKNECSHIHDALQYVCTRLFVSKEISQRTFTDTGEVYYDEDDNERFTAPARVGRSRIGGY